MVELIIPEDTQQETKLLGEEVAVRLKKTAVYSEDVAGFIGNGHFIREIAYACHVVGVLSRTMPLEKAIFLVDAITKHFLIRPMGIFQLIDFVGLDIVDNVARVMTRFLQPEVSFRQYLIKKMIDLKKIGGQNLDGSQKPGFFEYAKGPTHVYQFGKMTYAPLDSSWEEELQPFLDVIKERNLSWKRLKAVPDKKEILTSYFIDLFYDRSLSGEIAQGFLNNSYAIAQNLVRGEVAFDFESVELVLMLGFFHLYGPQFPYHCRGERWVL